MTAAPSRTDEKPSAAVRHWGPKLHKTSVPKDVGIVAANACTEVTLVLTEKDECRACGA